MKKLVPFANSQRNETFNNTVGSKNPKTRIYRGSVTQQNIGYGYVSRALEALCIDPGKNCIAQTKKLDEKVAHDMVRNSTKNFKIRRHQLHAQRLSKNTTREIKEGKMYETGIGLNLNVSGKRKGKTPKVGWKVELDKVTMDTRLEFEQMVPKFTERLVKICLRFDFSVVYSLIFFDLKTTGTGKTAEICQLSASNRNGSTYSRHVLQVCNM